MTMTEPKKKVSETIADPETRWETIDPERAEELLLTNEGNRNLRDRVVQSYVRDMHAGRWLVTGEAIKVARTGDLLDGQHRLQAIILSGKPQRLLVIYGLDPETRSVIDTGVPRTGGDALKMAGLGSSSPYALAAAARLYQLWEAGRLRFYSSGSKSADRVTHLEIVEIVLAHPDLEVYLKESIRDYERIGLPIGPMTAARKVLYDLDAKDAEVFWTALAGYATEGPNDPRAVLLYTIRQMRAMGELRRPGESLGLIFAAWNAWRDQQKITSLPTRDKKGQPLAIVTPV